MIMDCSRRAVLAMRSGSTQIDAKRWNDFEIGRFAILGKFDATTKMFDHVALLSILNPGLAIAIAEFMNFHDRCPRDDTLASIWPFASQLQNIR
jgi:hypothetical protein